MTTLEQILQEGRKIRGFRVHDYIEEKVALINSFLQKNKLDSVVLGLSGGIDSCLVLALLVKASLHRDSPLKRIDSLSLPMQCTGVTGQYEATRKAQTLVDHLVATQPLFDDTLRYSVVDLTSAYDAYVKESRNFTSDWTRGQLASIVRTPYLYFRAAILQQQGYRSVVSGTTNRDEGAYIGFYGKMSDGLVDIQPIADIHKSEVYQVAEVLGVPDELIRQVPKGDVWDGRNDEQMIGSPYWFLEAYQLAMEYGLKPMFYELSDAEFKDYLEYSGNIEHLHKVNKHKYEVGSPSHYLDVINRKIPGGWQ